MIVLILFERSDIHTTYFDYASAVYESQRMHKLQGRKKLKRLKPVQLRQACNYDLNGTWFCLSLWKIPLDPPLLRGTFISSFASRMPPPFLKEGWGGLKITDKPHNLDCRLNMPLVLELLDRNLLPQ